LILVVLTAPCVVLVSNKVLGVDETKGESVKDAVSHVIHQTLKPGDGGMIALAHDGSICMDFNTPSMARAAANSSGRFEAQRGK
jgi:isoaspartyl peptidase/L-asparaginase-like protein (Ntn-hydrolase superfamily)